MPTKTEGAIERIRISEKQAKLATEFIAASTGPKRLNTQEINKTAMLLRVGYSPNTAIAKQKELFSSQGFKLALANAGVTEEKISDTFSNALDAKRIIEYRGTETESQFADHHIKLKALETLKDYIGIKHQVAIESVNVDLTGDELAGFLNLSCKATESPRNDFNEEVVSDSHSETNDAPTGK